MQATFIICVLLGHLLHFLFLRGMVNSAWLANFQALNNVMIPDMYCMGSIQDILHSAAQKGKIFAKLDCKDAFVTAYDLFTYLFIYIYIYIYI